MSGGGYKNKDWFRLVYTCTLSPEAPNGDEGHEPQPQVGPGHEEDVVRVVHCVEVAVPSVEHRLQRLEWINWF